MSIVLPPLHDATSSTSLRAQTQFTRATRAQLVLAVLAAMSGVLAIELEDPRVGAISGIIGFGLAALIRIYVLSTRPERRWYEGRAAAESVKTLAWRYAVRAAPFDLGAEDAEADSLLVSRLREVLAELSSLDPASQHDSQITPEMRDLRSADLMHRKRVYELERIEDQQRWYSEKAADNRRAGERWGLIVLSFQGLGLLSAVSVLAEWTEINVLGVAAAASAAAAAWLQTRQHENLATAYSLAAQELGAIRSLLAEPDGESEWSAFVEDAEEAISREHTTWRASRGVGRQTR